MAGRDTIETVAHKSRGCWWVMAVLCLCAAISAPNLFLWSKLVDLQEHRNKERWFWELCQPGYSEEDRSEAFAELLWIGNTEWRSARLQRLNLTGTQLAGADIQNAWMDGCKLIRADLTGAVLRQTHLRQSDLSRAILTRADLFEVDLLKSNLQGAVFDSADIRGGGLEQSNASGASFIGADLSGARMELIKLQGANLPVCESLRNRSSTCRYERVDSLGNRPIECQSGPSHASRRELVASERTHAGTDCVVSDAVPSG